MAYESSLTDRRMQAELDKHGQAAARLLDSLAARLGGLALHGSRASGSAVRDAAVRLERFARRSPAAWLLAGALTGFLAAKAVDRVRGRRL